MDAMHAAVRSTVALAAGRQQIKLSNVFGRGFAVDYCS